MRQGGGNGMKNDERREGSEALITMEELGMMVEKLATMSDFEFATNGGSAMRWVKARGVSARTFRELVRHRRRILCEEGIRAREMARQTEIRGEIPLSTLISPLK
jgi:hypothetical protein